MPPSLHQRSPPISTGRVARYRSWSPQCELTEPISLQVHRLAPEPFLRWLPPSTYRRSWRVHNNRRAVSQPLSASVSSRANAAHTPYSLVTDADGCRPIALRLQCTRSGDPPCDPRHLVWKLV